MGTVRRTITLTDQQDCWVVARTAASGLADNSEYIRDLIRRDQVQNAGFQTLEAAIQEGINNGASDRTAPRIMEEVETRLRADGRL